MTTKLDRRAVLGFSSGARRLTSKLLTDTRGANLVEYIMLVGLIAILCIVGFQTFGNGIKTKIQNQTNSLNTIVDTPQ